MKTTFDKTTRDELIDRINSLNENSTAQWGKMNSYQMVKHCNQWEELISGRLKCKRSFLGLIFGRMVLKKFLKDDSPMMRNASTSPEFKIKETNGNLASERTKWITLLKEHAHFSNIGIVHPFFGKMTKEQIGHLAYKHYDHHLRQFNS